MVLLIYKNVITLVIVILQFCILDCGKKENRTASVSILNGTGPTTTTTSRTFKPTYSPVPRVYVGDKVQVNRYLSKEDLVRYANLTGDTNPWYVYTPKLYHGPFLLGLVFGVIGTKLPGPGTLLINNTMRFPHACYIDQWITITVEVIHVDNPNYFHIITNFSVFSHTHKVNCLEGEAYAIIMFRYVGPWVFPTKYPSLGSYNHDTEWYPTSELERQKAFKEEYSTSSTIYDSSNPVD